MSTKNDITGDSLTSRVATEQYRDNWERIFKCNTPEPEKICKSCDCWKSKTYDAQSDTLQRGNH